VCGEYHPAGFIKKSMVSELRGPSSDLFTLVKVNEDDELVDVNLFNEKSNYLIASRNGMIIRFDGSEVRAMGLIAAGVNAIKLAPTDAVVGIVELKNKGEVVLISSNGISWRIAQENIPLQGRYGQGVIGCRLEKGTELVGVVFGKKNTQYGLRFKKLLRNHAGSMILPSAAELAEGSSWLHPQPVIGCRILSRFLITTNNW